MNVTSRLHEFRAFLSAAWPIACALHPGDDAPDFMSDWLQANWETLVEGSFPPQDGIVLEYYGDGAELNSPSGRVAWPDAKPTHEIVVVPSEGKTLTDVLDDIDFPVPAEGARFDKFVARAGQWFEEAPPFDHLLLDTDDTSTRLVRVSDCQFMLRPFVRP